MTNVEVHSQYLEIDSKELKLMVKYFMISF